VDHQRGGVVGRPARPSTGNQPLGGPGSGTTQRQDSDLGRRHDIRDAIATQHQAIRRLQIHQEAKILIRLAIRGQRQRRPLSKHIQQQRRSGMRHGLLGIHAPLRDLLVGPVMITGQLENLAVTHQVRAAVTHTDQRQLGAGNRCGDHGGANWVIFARGGAIDIHRAVSFTHGALEIGQWGAMDLKILIDQGVNR